jgi:hypothetical protein
MNNANLDKYKMLDKLQTLIREKRFIGYVEFMDYLKNNKDTMQSEYSVARSNKFFFSRYLSSCRRRAKN